MRRAQLWAATLLLAAAATSQAATLTITSDRDVYQVGELITLSVSGDAEGAADSSVAGRLLFDPGLAEHVSSSQVALESAGGFWETIPLTDGEGFATAFNQLTAPFGTPLIPTNLLSANLVLRATGAGVLDYEWSTGPPFPFRFFGLTDAPGGSVTIVPEPSAGALLSLGLAAMAVGRRARRRDAGTRTRLTRSRPVLRTGAAWAALLVVAPGAPSDASSQPSGSSVCADFLEHHLGDSDWKKSCIESLEASWPWLSASSSAGTASASVSSSVTGIWHVGADSPVRSAGNQSEISITADPSGSGRVFVIAMTAPFDHVGGPRNGFFAAMSENHGTTWTSMLVAEGPDMDSPQGSFDPWAVFSSQGRLFISYLKERTADETQNFQLPANEVPVVVAMWNETSERFEFLEALGGTNTDKPTLAVGPYDASSGKEAFVGTLPRWRQRLGHRSGRRAGGGRKPRARRLPGRIEPEVLLQRTDRCI